MNVEQLWVPIGLVAILFGIVASGSWWLSRLHFRADSHGDRLDKLEASHEQLMHTLSDLNLTIKKLDTLMELLGRHQ